MFYGRFEHNIDPKGRMTVPAAYRDQTPSGVFVTLGLDGNLMAYAKEKYGLIADSLNAITITDPDSRALRRRILGNTADLTFDSAGRILIPAYLRKYAKIENEVTIVGVGDSFEIWSPELLQAKEGPLEEAGDDGDRWLAFDITTRGNK
ncbi:MAG: division/cell wall cluster transcriptional repressor MraZ [Anaerolineaceae bacterium]|jgi:MraZ protein|nr:division/cell wall cluster transcriptional repressor MraZ [Anaerolineaceae bacterium]HNX46137.1 division/cell wall cluster transcriptional repressor MraZ [Anaerolineaceae bacterium]HPT24246.1 division/cell wall cluster transcriptional repressor MraZ [Anaerolineaceae bacterium]